MNIIKIFTHLNSERLSIKVVESYELQEGIVTYIYNLIVLICDGEQMLHSIFCFSMLNPISAMYLLFIRHGIQKVDDFSYEKFKLLLFLVRRRCPRFSNEA